MKKLILVVLLLAAPATAADIQLAWDANPEPITGYRVYAANVPDPYGATPLYEGTATTATVAVANSTELKFVVRAYLAGEDGAVYESLDSNEVRHAVVVWVNPNLRIQ